MKDLSLTLFIAAAFLLVIALRSDPPFSLAVWRGIAIAVPLGLGLWALVFALLYWRP